MMMKVLAASVVLLLVVPVISILLLVPDAEASVIPWRFASPKPTPIVLWHGMGDSANGSLFDLKVALRKAQPGVFIHSIRIGEDDEEDKRRGILGDATEQLKIACEQIASTPELQDGFDAIGFSQGGLFLRGLLERCAAARIKRLITFGSPHQGIIDVPPTWCTSSPFWCATARFLLKKGAYLPYVQHRVVSAAYYKAPHQVEDYLKGNLYLPVVNNENTINATYRSRMMALERLVLVRHKQDTVLAPLNSAWFYETIGDDEIPLRNTTLYREDTIGLRVLDERGALEFLEMEGDHVQFSIHDFLDLVVPRLARGPEHSSDVRLKPIHWDSPQLQTAFKFQS